MSMIRKAYDGVITFWKSPFRTVLSLLGALGALILHVIAASSEVIPSSSTHSEAAHSGLTFLLGAFGKVEVAPHGYFVTTVTVIAIFMALYEIYDTLKELASPHLEAVTKKVLSFVFWGTMLLFSFASAAHGDNELLLFTALFWLVLDRQKLIKMISDRED